MKRFGEKIEIRYTRSMNAPIILAHLQDPNKKYRQKTTNIRKEVEKAREKVANLLVPDHYKDVSEFREILESLLQTTSPSSHITELSLRNGQLYKKDRSKYTIDDEDQATLDNNTGSFVS